MMQRNVKPSGHMFNDAAEATWDEEHLNIALVQTVHKLPEKR